MTDEELIRAYLSGEEKVLPTLINRYAASLHGFIFGLVKSRGDAEDITQDAFFAAWKHIRRFDLKRSFRAWLFKIGKNAALNWLKRKKPTLFSEYVRSDIDAPFEDIEDSSPLPDELFSRTELREVLEGAMRRLNPSAQAVLELYYQYDFTFSEIAEALGESINTVKARHRRALIVLRSFLNAPK